MIAVLHHTHIQHIYLHIICVCIYKYMKIRQGCQVWSTPTYTLYDFEVHMITYTYIIYICFVTQTSLFGKLMAQNEKYRILR